MYISTSGYFIETVRNCYKSPYAIASFPHMHIYSFVYNDYYIFGINV